MSVLPEPAADPSPGRRVVVVDDHPLLAMGLKAQLEHAGMSVAVVNPVKTPDLVERILGFGPDLVLVDLDMPVDGGGVGLTQRLVDAGQAVAVLTGSTDRTLWAQCLENGAIALLTKDESLDTLIDDIGKLLAGESVRQHQRLTLIDEYREQEIAMADRRRGFDQLSERESQVLTGLMTGLSPASLADRDFVSVQTVRTQIKSVLAKLGVNSQLAAVARAHESGWEPVESPQ